MGDRRIGEEPPDARLGQGREVAQKKRGSGKNGEDGKPARFDWDPGDAARDRPEPRPKQPGKKDEPRKL